jgi:hypothetical protein
LFIRTVIIPPYCGVPSAFHQFPVTAVVVEVVVVGVVVLLLVVVVVVVVIVVLVVDVGVEVDVVVLLHDAKTSDVTMRKVSNPQIIPLFIQISFLFFTGILYLNSKCSFI